MRELRAITMAVILAVVAIAPPSLQASASVRVRLGYSRVANTAYLPWRIGPGLAYPEIRNLWKGAVVEVLSGPHGGGWYEVSYRDRTGYVEGRYLEHTSLAGSRIARAHTRVVVISLARQQMEVWERGKLLFVSSTTTGQPGIETPTGTTRVLAKRSPIGFVSPWPEGHPYYYLPTRVDYAVLFRHRGFFIHDAPWRPFYGYGTNVPHADGDGIVRTGSHGCVNLPRWAAKKLYDWIGIGTVVRVVGY